MIKAGNEEERYFIQDWMQHPAYEKVTDESRKIITRQLNRLVELAGDTEKEKSALAHSLNRLALDVESTHSSTL